MKQLSEGIKFGNKERSLVDSNVDRFAMGVEFEFHLNDGDEYSLIDEDILMPEIVRNNLLRPPEKEHDSQVEVVTKTVNPKVGLQMIKEMFSFIDEHAHTTDSSGLHISVSIGDQVDLMKFLVLMEMGYIVDNIFPERMHVANVDQKFSGYIERIFTNFVLMGDIDYTFSNKKILDVLVSRITKSALFMDKSQSIKLGDYEIHNGRIELRFFGGEDYEDRYDEIENHLYRALYILLVSTSNLYQKEYLKGLYTKVFNTIQEGARDALVALKLVRLYDSGRIETIDDYNKFYEKESRQAKKDGIEISRETVENLSIHDGVSVLKKIGDNDRKDLTPEQWKDLESIIGDMKARGAID